MPAAPQPRSGLGGMCGKAACAMQAGQGTAAQREYAEWLRQAKGERRTSREYGVHGGAPARPQPRGEPAFWDEARQRQQQQPWPQQQQPQQPWQQQQQLNGMQRQEHMLRQGATAQQQQQQPGQRQPQPRAPERKAAFAPKPRAPKEIVLPQGVTAQQLAALLGAGLALFPDLSPAEQGKVAAKPAVQSLQLHELLCYVAIQAHTHSRMIRSSTISR